MEILLNGVRDTWFPRSDLCPAQVDIDSELGMMGCKHGALTLPPLPHPLWGLTHVYTDTGANRMSCMGRMGVYGPKWPRSGSVPLIWLGLVVLEHHQSVCSPALRTLFSVGGPLFTQRSPPWVCPDPAHIHSSCRRTVCFNRLRELSSSPSAEGASPILTVPGPLVYGNLEYCFVKEKLN